MKRTIWTVAVWLTSVMPALAHPGHGTIDPENPAHYVFEPVHGVPLVVLAAACAAVVWRTRSTRR